MTSAARFDCAVDDEERRFLEVAAWSSIAASAASGSSRSLRATSTIADSARAGVEADLAIVRHPDQGIRDPDSILDFSCIADLFDYRAFDILFDPAGALTHIAVERQAQVGKEEGGSNFSTISNQLAFLNYPELLANTASSSFDPLILAGGDTDLFVVAPEETIEHVKGWLRLWVAIPNAVAGMKPLERDLLIVIDEMPRLGYLKPVMDGYTMAAGKGVHFWCFAQSISALDSTWGKEHRKTLLHLAELVQVLGFPRTDAEGAEELSKAIGTATFEGRTESRSGTVAESRIVTANTQWQAGESTTLVRERLVTPDELMTLGPDRQYVIAAAKDMPRDALHLHHARYWVRRDARFLADANPFVLRKERAAGKADTGGRLRWLLSIAGGSVK